jgi:hypothetical protein
MTHNPDEIVKVAYGELVDITMYQQALSEAGIESQVGGQSLDANFGSALMESMELYVHARDAEAALATIRRLEEEKARRTPPEPA